MYPTVSDDSKSAFFMMVVLQENVSSWEVALELGQSALSNAPRKCEPAHGVGSRTMLRTSRVRRWRRVGSEPNMDMKTIKEVMRLPGPMAIWWEREREIKRELYEYFVLVFLRQFNFVIELQTRKFPTLSPHILTLSKCSFDLNWRGAPIYWQWSAAHVLKSWWCPFKTHHE